MSRTSTTRCCSSWCDTTRRDAESRKIVLQDQMYHAAASTGNGYVAGTGTIRPFQNAGKQFVSLTPQSVWSDLKRLRGHHAR
eukprot:4979973-Pyramimonas_sp.AAC.1